MMSTSSRRSLRLLHAVDEKTWWRVAEHCPYATFSHTPAWQTLVLEAFPDLQPATLAAECPDGTLAILPLIRTGSAAKGLLHGQTSTFAGCYGGPIADGPLDDEVVATLYRVAVGRRVATLEVCGNPYAPHSLPALTGTHTTTDTTHVIELSLGHERLRSGYSRSHRNAANRARKAGVQVRESRAEEDYRRYYRLYRDTLERWGDRATSVYPRRLFEAGARLAARHPRHIRLWLAERDGEAVAGAWTFAWNGHLYYWHGASRAEEMSSGVNQLLQDEIIRQAAAEGFRHYDLYPSGGHAGVETFKRRFGARALPLTRWHYSGRTVNFLQALRRDTPDVTPAAAG